MGRRKGPETIISHIELDLVTALAKAYPTMFHEKSTQIPSGTDVYTKFLALRRYTNFITHHYIIGPSIKYLWDSDEFGSFTSTLQLLLSVSTRLEFTIVTLNLGNIIGNLSQQTEMRDVPNLCTIICFAFSKKYAQLIRLEVARLVYQQWLTLSLDELTDSYERMYKLQALPLTNLDKVTYASAVLRQNKLKKWELVV